MCKISIYMSITIMKTYCGILENTVSSDIISISPIFFYKLKLKFNFQFNEYGIIYLT